ncbi:MAG: DegV family EDD domain-containing protein [Bacilli bacterium]|nr:DegV family EDD domain-containing protein [Bacilli bacterium]
MKPIKIFTDSCSDMIEKTRKSLDVVSIDFTIYYDRREITADPWKAVQPSDLYDSLRMGNRIYTLPATENEIRNKFKKYVKDYDILYIAACEKQSTTIVKARRVAQELMALDENYRIEIVDSMNASIGESLVTMEACKLRDEGLKMEEIIEKLLPIRKRIIQFATVDTLTYLSKANKINARTAALGNLFKIKPVLISDADGNQTSMKSVKGKENSLNEIVSLFMQNVENPEDQVITIIHGDEPEAAEIVEEKLIASGLKCKSIEKFCVGPVVGITTGPGMVGIFGFGKEVTFRGE